MARNALWAVLLSSITIGSLVAVNSALDSTRSEPIKGSIGITLPDPRIHGIVVVAGPQPLGAFERIILSMLAE